MRFWRRDARGEIEGRLRGERPEPSADLVQAIEGQIDEHEVRGRRFWGSRTGRLVCAGVLTLGLLASLGGFGGLSYAASSAGSSAASAVKLAKVSVGLKKATPSAANKATKPNDDGKKKKKKDDDDDKKKKKCKKGDDSDDPARDQYEDDDDKDDCD